MGCDSIATTISRMGKEPTTLGPEDLKGHRFSAFWLRYVKRTPWLFSWVAKEEPFFNFSSCLILMLPHLWESLSYKLFLSMLMDPVNLVKRLLCLRPRNRHPLGQ